MEWKSMTDEEFNAVVKEIRDETEYYKSLEKGVVMVDGFSAFVSYDRESKQYNYTQMCPPKFVFPVAITKEQASIIKREMKKLDEARECL